MSMNSRSNTHTSTGEDLGPLLTALIAVCLFLFGFPAWLLGLLAQRQVSRWLSWRWSFLLWVLLTFLSAYLVFLQYQHGLQELLTREVTAYVLTIKHAQADFTRWPWGTLWAVTWPVWVHTLLATPIAALFLEVSTNTRGGQTARQLRQSEHQRQRAAARSQRQARKRTSRPIRMPDEVGGMMVIGVPIRDDEEDASHG